MRIQQESLLAAERHYAAETIWYHTNFWLGIPSTVLAAIAGAAAFSKIANSEFVAGSIAILVAILTSLTTFIDPKKTFTAHHLAAKEFESLYHQAGFFYRLVSHGAISDAELEKRLEELRSTFIQHCKQSLPISGAAHKHAYAVIAGKIPGEVLRTAETTANHPQSS
jgi:hypothetical protein